MKLEHFRSNTSDHHGVPDEVYHAARVNDAYPLGKDRIYNPENNGTFEVQRKDSLHHSRLYAPVTIIYPDGNSVVQEFIEDPTDSSEYANWGAHK